MFFKLIILELVKINEEKGVPLDLEPYVKKLNNAKRRVMLVNNILQNVQVGYWVITPYVLGAFFKREIWVRYIDIVGIHVYCSFIYTFLFLILCSLKLSVIIFIIQCLMVATHVGGGKQQEAKGKVGQELKMCKIILKFFYLCSCSSSLLQRHYLHMYVLLFFNNKQVLIEIDRRIFVLLDWEEIKI